MIPLMHRIAAVLLSAAFLQVLVPRLLKPAAAAETVTWILAEFPPLVIDKAPPGQEGFGEKQLRFLQTRLPQFHHVILKATTSRLWHEMQTADGVCTLSVAKLPDRERFALFSRRAYYGTTNQMIVRTEDMPKFAPFLDKSGAIDLSLLAEDDRLIGAYSDGTTYGAAIDGFIHNPSRKTPLQPVAHLRFPVALLDKKRVDFIFGYYMEMAYFRRANHLRDAFTALRTIPEQPRLGGYIACGKKPVGEKVIAAVDALLASDETMLEFIEPLREWYSPADFEAARNAVKSTGAGD